MVRFISVALLKWRTPSKVANSKRRDRFNARKREKLESYVGILSKSFKALQQVMPGVQHPQGATTRPNTPVGGKSASTSAPAVSNPVSAAALDDLLAAFSTNFTFESLMKTKVLRHRVVHYFPLIWKTIEREIPQELEDLFCPGPFVSLPCLRFLLEDKMAQVQAERLATLAVVASPVEQQAQSVDSDNRPSTPPPPPPTLPPTPPPKSTVTELQPSKAALSELELSVPSKLDQHIAEDKFRSYITPAQPPVSVFFAQDTQAAEIPSWANSTFGQHSTTHFVAQPEPVYAPAPVLSQPPEEQESVSQYVFGMSYEQHTFAARNDVEMTDSNQQPESFFTDAINHWPSSHPSQTQNFYSADSSTFSFGYTGLTSTQPSYEPWSSQPASTSAFVFSQTDPGQTSASSSTFNSGPAYASTQAQPSYETYNPQPASSDTFVFGQSNYGQTSAGLSAFSFTPSEPVYTSTSTQPSYQAYDSQPTASGMFVFGQHDQDQSMNMDTEPAPSSFRSRFGSRRWGARFSRYRSHESEDPVYGAPSAYNASFESSSGRYQPTQMCQSAPCSFSGYPEQNIAYSAHTMAWQPQAQPYDAYGSNAHAFSFTDYAAPYIQPQWSSYPTEGFVTYSNQPYQPPPEPAPPPLPEVDMHVPSLTELIASDPARPAVSHFSALTDIGRNATASWRASLPPAMLRDARHAGRGRYTNALIEAEAARVASREKARRKREAQEETRKRKAVAERSQQEAARVERETQLAGKREKRRQMKRQKREQEAERARVEELRRQEAELRQVEAERGERFARIVRFAQPVEAPRRMRVVVHPYFPPQTRSSGPIRRERPRAGSRSHTPSPISVTSTLLELQEDMEPQRYHGPFKAAVKIASRFCADFWSEVCR